MDIFFGLRGKYVRNKLSRSDIYMHANLLIHDITDIDTSFQARTARLAAPSPPSASTGSTATSTACPCPPRTAMPGITATEEPASPTRMMDGVHPGITVRWAAAHPHLAQLVSYLKR